MANKTNQYGRQIFLTRSNIERLRKLVDDDIGSLQDYARDSEDLLESPNEETVQVGRESIADAEREIAELQALRKKLWYYVREDELGSKS
jgi:hypothetical protein